MPWMDTIALSIPSHFYLCFSWNHLWPGILLESYQVPLHVHQRQQKDLWSQAAMKRIRRRVPEMEAGEPWTHIFPYFLILSRKLGSLCFHLPILSSWNFKVMCAIILVFQPKIQESSWFCARVYSDLSLTFLSPLFYSLVLYIIYFYICLL